MVKNLPAMQETCKRPGFDPWVGKIPQHGNGYPLHYSCLKNSMDRRAWQATVHGVAKSSTQLSNLTTTKSGKTLESATWA